MSALTERFRPLFHPRGVVITGVSSHPGKFGSVAYHNLIACGYRLFRPECPWGFAHSLYWTKHVRKQEQPSACLTAP